MKTHSSYAKVQILEKDIHDASKMELLFKEDHITLVVLKREVSTFDSFLKSANLSCTQTGATGKERVLLIEEADLLTELKAVKVPAEGETTLDLPDVLTAVYKTKYPDKTLSFDDVLAFSIFPETGKIAYVVTKNKANFIEVRNAFTTVTKNLPTN